MMLVGLTGSIGMGKSTTAQLFAAEGVPVYDSDAIVHEIYRQPAVVAEIGKQFPGAVVEGVLDRNRLAALVLDDAERLKCLEGVIHPLVWRRRDEFLRAQEAKGETIAVLDIPLLFETGADKQVDAIVVVTSPQEVQRQRVLSRPNMTPEKFAAILAKQVPDEEKRRRADFIIQTDQGVEVARKEVSRILAALRARLKEKISKPK